MPPTETPEAIDAFIEAFIEANPPPAYLAIPRELQSAADGVVIAVNHLAALLGAKPVPHDAPTADAITRYGAQSGDLQIWFAWRAVRRFTPAWKTYAAEAHPPEGERPKTTV